MLDGLKIELPAVLWVTHEQFRWARKAQMFLNLWAWLGLLRLSLESEEADVSVASPAPHLSRIDGHSDADGCITQVTEENLE